MIRVVILAISTAVLVWRALSGPVVAPAAMPFAPEEFAPGGKAQPTADMIVNAGFYATGSPYWNGGYHSGTDYALTDGQPAYYPFDCTYLSSGYYPDAGRHGYYAMCILDDGSEFYAGHFKSLADYAPGERIPAGGVIGWGDGDMAHTHIQLRGPDGGLVDFESYYEER